MKQYTYGVCYYRTTFGTSGGLKSIGHRSRLDAEEGGGAGRAEGLLLGSGSMGAYGDCSLGKS